VPFRPIRSILPANRSDSVEPASYTAKRMLDEPPLIVRMQGIANFVVSIMTNQVNRRTVFEAAFSPSKHGRLNALPTSKVTTKA
jgi:hypothetical protein